MVTTRPPKTIVKPTALGPVANTDTKLLIYGLFQKGRVLAQDGMTSSEPPNHRTRWPVTRPPYPVNAFSRSWFHADARWPPPAARKSAGASPHLQATVLLECRARMSRISPGLLDTSHA